MSESWFSRGYNEASEARKKLGSMFRPEVWLKPNESVELIFLDREPVNIFVHTLKIRGQIKKYTCRKRGCPLCAVDNPRFLSVYRVIDTREYTDRSGKKHVNTEKYLEVGTRAQPLLERLEKKELMYRRVVEMTRTGEGTKTVYSFLPVGKPSFDVKKPTLDFERDYAPKSVEELETVAEVLDGNDDGRREPTREEPKRKARDYYEETTDEGSDEDSSKPGDDDPEDAGEDDVDPEETEEDDDQDEEPPPPPMKRQRK